MQKHSARQRKLVSARYTTMQTPTWRADQQTNTIRTIGKTSLSIMVLCNSCLHLSALSTKSCEYLATRAPTERGICGTASCAVGLIVVTKSCVVSKISLHSLTRKPQNCSARARRGATSSEWSVNFPKPLFHFGTAAKCATTN